MNAKGEIIKLIEIFNGEIYLRKVLKRFEDWVKVYEEKYEVDNILMKGRGRSPMERGGWLSGLIDAEGYLLVTLSKDKIGGAGSLYYVKKMQRKRWKKYKIW